VKLFISSGIDPIYETPAFQHRALQQLQSIPNQIHRNNMKTEGNGTEHTIEHIADEAGLWFAASGDMAEEQLVEAKKRLAQALEAAKEAFAKVQEKTVQGAKAADKAIRKNPYPAIGIAVGVGALIGYLATRRRD
jgi:ElaB/YqjD/DUF883 family membrane-anchored ribosome-binding protein